MKSYVRRVVCDEQKRIEKTTAVIRLGVFAVLLISFLTLKRDFPWTTLPVTILMVYGMVGVTSLALEKVGIFRPWFAWVYSTIDVLVLFIFLGVLAEHYDMPLPDVLRVPGASLIFLFIALSAFRYQASLVIYVGVLYGVLWIAMILVYAGGDNTTAANSGFVLPLEVEYMRLAITIFVTALTALMVYRMNKLLLSSIVEARSKSNLAKYLPADLVREMADGGVNLIGESHSQNAAVLFVDIRGFTAMSEDMPAKMVTDFLTEFRRRMNRAIISHGGTIDKFIGDAIMVVFGVPEPGELDARNAVLCGINMLDNLEIWNKERVAQDKPRVGIGIGIHYGEVVAGALGDETRIEYTVIGDSVNVAERIEALTRKIDTSLLISAVAYENAKPLPETIVFVEVPEQKLSGRHASVDLFAYKRFKNELIS